VPGKRRKDIVAAAKHHEVRSNGKEKRNDE
jgi:hypothetical protein